MKPTLCIPGVHGPDITSAEALKEMYDRGRASGFAAGKQQAAGPAYDLGYKAGRKTTNRAEADKMAHAQLVDIFTELARRARNGEDLLREDYE